MENYLHAFQRVLPHFQWIDVVRFECRWLQMMMYFPSVLFLRIVHGPDLENTHKRTRPYKNEVKLNREIFRRPFSFAKPPSPSPSTSFSLSGSVSLPTSLLAHSSASKRSHCIIMRTLCIVLYFRM